MYKKTLTVILLSVLVFSLPVGIVSAKKPDKPPGRPEQEKDTFRIFVGTADDGTPVGDVVLLNTIPYPYPQITYFDVVTYVDDWDYTGGVDEGDPNEVYRWSFWDGANGEPMIAYGIFEFADKFYDLDGITDLRPDDIDPNDGIHTGYAQLMSVGRGIDVDDRMDWSYFSLLWMKEVNGELVEVLLLGRTLLDEFHEGDYAVNEDDTVASWKVTFETEGTTTNTEFRFMYWWYETIEIEIGKSGKIKTESQYCDVRIWDLDGGDQPEIPVSITTNVVRSP
jgi:hypothetical protein